MPVLTYNPASRMAVMDGPLGPDETELAARQDWPREHARKHAGREVLCPDFDSFDVTTLSVDALILIGALVYLKSRFMYPDMAGYEEQKAFDDRLRSIPELDLSGYGPSPEEFWRVVNACP